MGWLRLRSERYGDFLIETDIDVFVNEEWVSEIENDIRLCFDEAIEIEHTTPGGLDTAAYLVLVENDPNDLDYEKQCSYRLTTQNSPQEVDFPIGPRQTVYDGIVTSTRSLYSNQICLRITKLIIESLRQGQELEKEIQSI